MVFNSSGVLGLAGVYGTFPALNPRHTYNKIVHMCYSLVSSDAESFSEPGAVRFQPVLHDD